MKLIHHVTLLWTSPLFRMQNTPHRIIMEHQVPMSKFTIFILSFATSHFQSVCEESPVHVGVVHVTTDSTVKHWNEISLCRPRILPAPITHFANASTYVNKFCEIDCLGVFSLDVSTTADPDPINVLKSYDEIEGSTFSILTC